MARTPIDEIANPRQRRLASNLKRNLKRRRSELGLRQVDVAEKSGLSVKYIADIEQGKAGNPTLEVICVVAEGVGLKNPLDLFS